MQQDFQRIELNAFGDPSVLKLATAQLGDVADNKVRIKVLSASINPIDVKTRAGLGFAAEQNKNSLPFSLGYDLFGEVVHDAGVFKAGDLVMGMVGFAASPGTYGQYCDVNHDEVIKVQASKEEYQLSGLCLAGLTAFQAISSLNCPKTQPIYVNGANGSVGSLIVQIAANMGYQVVAISRSELPEAVASRCQHQSYEQFTKEPKKAYFIDVVGQQVGIQSLMGLAAGSVMATIPTLSHKQIIDAASEQGIKAKGILVVKNKAQLKCIYQWYRQGKLNLAHKCMPLNAAAIAHKKIEQNSSKEKLILLPWS